jgi:hypothetical protein
MRVRRPGALGPLFNRRRRMTMDRDEARHWRLIIKRDMQLASYSLAMGHGAKEYLRRRIAENEAILYALAAFESVRTTRDAAVAPYTA